MTDSFNHRASKIQLDSDKIASALFVSRLNDWASSTRILESKVQHYCMYRVQGVNPKV